ncbi:hypothetical protein SLEP1_g45425 [Rubroshorea leprosula]|uniref:Gnk2-homologous domain-containing protein n=1 Tax=Rubroshorea leprosula TaxID=152421 RepID=A0AAV5LKR1_9ROSI|nr:hypothetical protein SLEP1_g45425 [Rubroshorea leprosula]
MSCFRFFLTFFVLSLLSLTTEAQNNPNYLYHICDNTTFIRNRTYQTNLNRLLSAFPNATAINGFYNTTSGEEPNRIYGFFLCRGDVLTTTCRNCVTFATGDVIQKCPVEKEAVIWYDECLLRYSNKSIFSTLSEMETKYLVGVQTDTDPIQFNEVQKVAMNDAVAQAVSVAKRFATKEANISRFRTLYGLVQCTPDLSSKDCDRCLRVAIGELPKCCFGRNGGRVLNPSCFFRFEIYPFYNGASAPPPTTVTTSPDSMVNPNGSKPRWIPIAASLSAVLGLALLSSFAFVIWRMRKSQEDKENSRKVQLLDLGGGNFVNEYSNENFHGERVGGSQEFPSIQLDIIHAATKHFCDENRLGEGGFGPVYKGTLTDGKEIAESCKTPGMLHGG